MATDPARARVIRRAMLKFMTALSSKPGLVKFVGPQAEDDGANRLLSIEHGQGNLNQLQAGGVVKFDGAYPSLAAHGDVVFRQSFMGPVLGLGVESHFAAVG